MAESFDSPEPDPPPDKRRALDDVAAAASTNREGRHPARDEEIDSNGQTFSGEFPDLEGYGKIANAMAFLDQVRLDLASPSTQDTVSRKIQNTLPGVRVPPNPGSVDSPVSSLIGRFQVLRVIGEGGFARVWLAYDPVLHRQVAIKAPRARRFSSPDAIARFEREARAAAVLSHPNIVPVFEVGFDRGEHFIVSAYCPGVTLATWFEKRQRKIEPRLAAQIVNTLANAMEHAHQRGIVHRDLKPANILVELPLQPDPTTNDEPIVLETPGTDHLLRSLRIADFGLARFSEPDDVCKTAEGAIVGTPAYMSPEQAAGLPEITAASDLYALGVILYELLTGRLPILGKSDIDTLLAINQQEPRPPQRNDGIVSRDLQSVCMKCLRKHPGQRYPTARELADDLQRWLEGKAVVARPVTRLERTWKWCQRYPWLTIAIVGIMACLGIAVGQWRRANNNFRIAEMQNQRSEKNVALSRETIAEIASLASDSRRIPPEIRLDLIQRAVKFQRTLLASTPDDQDILADTVVSILKLSRAFGDMRQFEAAIQACDDGLALLATRKSFPGSNRLGNTLKYVKAVHLKDAGQIAEAVDLLNADRNNLPIMERINNAIALGEIAEEEHRFDEAWLSYQQALIWHESRPRKNLFIAAEKAQLLMHVGHVELNLQRFSDSVQSLEAALENQNEIMAISPYHETMVEELALILDGLATAETELKHLTKAGEHLQKCSETYNFLIVRNPLNVRYQAKGFDVRLRQVRLQVQTGDLDSVHENLAKLCADYELLGEQASEQDELGRDLAELLIDWLEAYRNVPDSTDLTEALNQVKRSFGTLRERTNDQKFFQELQLRLDQIESDLQDRPSGS